MKRIICFVLMLVMCASLFCGCYSTTDENGREVDGYYDFVILRKMTEYDWVVYDKNTSVVFYLEQGTHGGYLTPYQIYQDGALYGAVYEDGKIVPKPYAMGITEEMIDNYIGSIFG